MTILSSTSILNPPSNIFFIFQDDHLSRTKTCKILSIKNLRVSKITSFFPSKNKIANKIIYEELCCFVENLVARFDKKASKRDESDT